MLPNLESWITLKQNYVGNVLGNLWKIGLILIPSSGHSAVERNSRIYLQNVFVLLCSNTKQYIEPNRDKAEVSMESTLFNAQTVY